MKARRAIILITAGLIVAPVARSGHEQPVYPSYYPHEIEIAAVDPQRAGALLIAGQLHAYVGRTSRFEAPAPDGFGSVPSLDSFVVVRLNANSAYASDEISACAVVGAIVREMATKGGDVIAHPYPITPLHGDYLHHADLAEAASSRLAGSVDAWVSAARGFKVRAEGALAQDIVRPEWRAEDADWDAVVYEVDARRLVESATALVNGWSGPRWVRLGWFHAHRVLAEWVEPQFKERVEADIGRLQTGDVVDATERANLERDLVRQLTTGCRAAVAGYTLRREYFNATFSAGIENIAYDALEGFSSPMFLRTVKLKDFPWNGWLQLGVGQPPAAAWNPIGGFTDDFGRLMWFAMGDTATIPSPYDHGWVLNRISEVEASPRK